MIKPIYVALFLAMLALNVGAVPAQAQSLSGGAIFSSAQKDLRSYVRFYNTGTTSRAVTASLYDYTAGTLLGQWTSPSIPAGAQFQFSIETIESGIGIITKPAYYSLSIKSDFTGYFQHVLYRPSQGTLTNLSTCDVGVTADATKLSGVHSSIVGDLGFPSSIVVNNTGATASVAVLGIYDARNGKKIGTFTTASIPSRGLVLVTVASIESAAKISPISDMYHYVIKSEGALFSGFLQHLVDNQKAGVITDMTTVCALHPNSFETTAYVFPDASEYYRGLCNKAYNNLNNPFTSLVTPVDLNRDGRKDLVVHFWCSAEPPGVIVPASVPTPDNLVVFLSNPDGTYEIGNQKIFGNKFMKLGGASRKVSVADMNNDGYPDLAYAMNAEDKRFQQDASTNTTKPAILLSQNGNGYKVENLGERSWGHAVDFVKMPSGGSDAVFAGFTTPLIQAFRLQGSIFSNVSETYNILNIGDVLAASAFRFFPELTVGTGSTVAVAPTKDPVNWNLFYKETGGWRKVSTTQYKSVVVSKFKIYTGEIKQSTFTSVQGNDFIAAAHEDACTIALSPGAARIALGKFSGRLIEGGYKEGTIYEETKLPIRNFLFGYSVEGGTISEVLNIFDDYKADVFFNFYDCRDVNGDGYEDVVALINQSGPMNTRGKPIVYLNNKKNKLVRLETEGFPDVPAISNLHGFLADMDGDGFEDLIYFTEEPSWVRKAAGKDSNDVNVTYAPDTPTSLPIIMFRGKKHLVLPAAVI